MAQDEEPAGGSGSSLVPALEAGATDGTLKIISPDAAFKGDATVTPKDRFNFSKIYAYIILALLVATTVVVVILIGYLTSVDVDLITRKLIGPKDRLITEKVILELIAATFIQVGLGFYFIVQSLFKWPQSTSNPNSLPDAPQ